MLRQGDLAFRVILVQDSCFSIGQNQNNKNNNNQNKNKKPKMIKGRKTGEKKGKEE